MEIYESPLNLAHLAARKAELKAAKGRLNEAIQQHNLAADYLSEVASISSSTDLNSISLQKNYHIRQAELLNDRKAKTDRLNETYGVGKLPSAAILKTQTHVNCSNNNNIEWKKKATDNNNGTCFNGTCSNGTCFNGTCFNGMCSNGTFNKNGGMCETKSSNDKTLIITTDSDAKSGVLDADGDCEDTLLNVFDGKLILSKRKNKIQFCHKEAYSTTTDNMTIKKLPINEQMTLIEELQTMNEQLTQNLVSILKENDKLERRKEMDRENYEKLQRSCRVMKRELEKLGINVEILERAYVENLK